MKGTLAIAKSPQQLAALLIGDCRRSEFADPLAALQKLSQLRHAADVDAAVESLRRGRTPELIVVAQRRPGDFGREQIELLRRHAPLARIAMLLGSWCEGEQRAADQRAPGVMPVYWHQFSSWLHNEADALSQCRGALWGLPLTAGVDEQVRFHSRRRSLHGSRLVLIDAADEDSADAHRFILDDAGFLAVWTGPHHDAVAAGACAAVVDAEGMDGAVLDRIHRLRKAYRALPLVALVHFLRLQDVEAAREAGAEAVLGKPFTVAEFLGQLELAIAGYPQKTAGAA